MKYLSAKKGFLGIDAELNGSPHKIDAFINLIKPLGLSEVSRTGVVAIARGNEKM